jgi:predicted acylesterase/phospholipase RssA
MNVLNNYMSIKHIVISGGGPTMLGSLGTIHHLIKEKFLNIDNIESIYGTSAGVLVAVLLCLKFDIETVYDYIIKRPWHTIFPIRVQDIFDAYTKKGIFDIKTLEKCFKPLFDAKDLSMDITLEDFYNYSKIELHAFTFEINDFKLEDISYLTHPKLSLLQALLMTCSLPILVTPVCFDSKCYTDGGMVCNYPLKYCIESGKNENEILGIKNLFDVNEKNIIEADSTLLDFIIHFLFKAIYNLSIDHTQPSIKYEIICNTISLTINEFKISLNSIEKRTELYNKGKDFAEEFLSKLKDSV